MIYKLFSNGVFLGYAEDLTYIRKSDNGCFVQTDKQSAQGVAYKSVAYSFAGDKLQGCPEVVICEASVDEINNALNETRANLAYVMMMTDTAIPVDDKEVVS